jgi:hypothetical protein
MTRNQELIGRGRFRVKGHASFGVPTPRDSHGHAGESFTAGVAVRRR